MCLGWMCDRQGGAEWFTNTGRVAAPREGRDDLVWPMSRIMGLGPNNMFKLGKGKFRQNTKVHFWRVTYILLRIRQQSHH